MDAPPIRSGPIVAKAMPGRPVVTKGYAWQAAGYCPCACRVSTTSWRLILILLTADPRRQRRTTCPAITVKPCGQKTRYLVKLRSLYPVRSTGYCPRLSSEHRERAADSFFINRRHTPTRLQATPLASVFALRATPLHAFAGQLVRHSFMRRRNLSSNYLVVA